ncbi:hypothetical protein EON67_05660 [archaeon]|nr:MAG: hypothetical protein EON67_05660 [archaeon]
MAWAEGGTGAACRNSRVQTRRLSGWKKVCVCVCTPAARARALSPLPPQQRARIHTVRMTTRLCIACRRDFGDGGPGRRRGRG